MGPAKKSLARILGRLGLCSRSQAEEWIRAGRISLNGRILRDPEVRLDSRQLRLHLDGRELQAQRLQYFALHKPSGVLTSAGDPQGRKTIYDLLPQGNRWLAPVGRLDRDTSGLLLLTNDSRWAAQITDPSSHLEKIYRVRTARPIQEEELAQLRRGVELTDGPTRPARVTLIAAYKSYALLEIAITEGRNRQVRRMLEAVSNRVVKLKRTAIGNLLLGSLPSGKMRPLRPAEVSALAKPGSAPGER